MLQSIAQIEKNPTQSSETHVDFCRFFFGQILGKSGNNPILKTKKRDLYGHASNHTTSI
jgi:hypothetical protein